MFANTQYKFPLIFAIALLVLILVYHFTYVFPFTNNAFVVANTRAVAANVNGYITDIYVKNEDYVKKGQPLFTVFKKPYELAWQKAVADFTAAQARLVSLQMQMGNIGHLLQAERDSYDRLNFNYQHHRRALGDHAVSVVKVNNLLQEMKAAQNRVKALEKSLEKAKQDILVQEAVITSLAAIRDNAKVDLDETTVYAKNNGIVHNMFVTLGTPVIIRKPLFSFVDTDQLFIQANFNETDLRHVRPGDKVNIYPRMYLWRKSYHGTIVSNHWAANRQSTDRRSQEQIVTNSENNWFLLPQRFPVQIRITDYDATHYPLAIGSSAYVYVHTTG